MTRTLQWALALSLIVATVSPAPAAEPADALDRLVRRFNHAVDAGDVARAERIAARAARAFPDAPAVGLMVRHLEATAPMGAVPATEAVSTADLMKLVAEQSGDVQTLALMELRARRSEGYRPDAQVAAVREVWQELMRQGRYEDAGKAVESCTHVESMMIHADVIRMSLRSQFGLPAEPSQTSAAEEIAALVYEYNELFQQRRYAEAEVLAKQAKELAPESPVAETMLWKAKFARRDARNQELRLAKEDCFWCTLPELDENGQIVDQPAKAAKSWDELTRARQSRAEATTPDCSMKERLIRQRLQKSVSLDFKDVPLSKVFARIAESCGIDIVVDELGLEEEGVRSDAPVSICVEDVQLRSALNLLLGPMNLGWTAEDEVLKITGKRRAQGRLEVRTYPVADLVVPIQQSPQCELEGDKPCPTVQPAAHAEKAADQPKAVADFESLTELITRTVQPESWVEKGGEASVRAFETTLSLVVRQTEQGHEEVRDLLEQLRREQGTQVTMEFRFITVPEDFFERVGIDFDFNVQPAVAESGSGVHSIQPVEHVELPGGVTTEHGQAVLTHEQCKRFVQAMQDDPRGNIMFAPKVTAFNGQRVEVASVTKPNPYTTAVDFALAARPVISQDRRTVSGAIQCEAGAATGEERTIEFRLPDGHTLLVDCGEVEDRARNQVQGAPVLSKVPYISRLFKNTGVQHTKRRLLLVTPRIHVEEEEEELLGVPVR